MLIGKDEQLDILLNFKSNLNEVVKESVNSINTLNTRITALQNRWNEIAKSRTKAANEERKDIARTISMLEKRKQSEIELAQTRTKFSSDALRQHKQAFDNIIKDQQVISNGWTKVVKERLTNEIKADKEAKKLRDQELKAQEAWRNKINKFNDDVQKLNTKSYQQKVNDEQAMSNAIVAIKEAEYKKQQKLQADADKEAKKRRDRSWEGAWFGSDSGTTFGHKFLTTTQYALAGTGIYAVAGAMTALATAALESELNMRTMAAVLEISIPEAKELDASVRQLGETYGGTTTEIEKVALALGRAGIQTKDVTDATEIVLAMARLTGDTFEQSSNAIISYQQVFGNTTPIQTLGDKLAYVANVSRLSTQDIGTFSNYALAAAKDVGLTEDAVGGLAAAFSNAGVNASTTGTQIRRFTTLLTDDSEAVTNFFRTLGVNQANLLADLQKGGKESNEALLGFVHTLTKVDKATFTNLAGQMDILAANSVQLMRNNSDNITKFVRDLQTGVEGQLSNTEKILASYIVTYESLWNRVKNIASDVLQSDFFASARLSAGVLLDTFASGNQQQLTILAYQKQQKEKEIADLNKLYADGAGTMADFSYITKLNQLQADIADMERQARELTGTNKPKARNYKEEVDHLNRLIELQEKHIDSIQNDDLALKASLDTMDKLRAQKKELITLVDKEEAQRKTSIDSSVSLSKRLELINTLKTAGINTAQQEKQLNDAIYESTSKNIDAMLKQIQGLDKSSTVAYTNVKSLMMPDGKNLFSNDAIAIETAIIDRLTALSKMSDDVKATDDYRREVNVYKELEKINSSNLESKRIQLTLQNQSTKELTTQTKAIEKQADVQYKIDSRREIAQTKINELSNRLLNQEDDSIGRAEDKLRVETQLVALAYEKYNTAIGTKREAEALVHYEEAMVTYLDQSVKYTNKLMDLESKRKEFAIEINSAIGEAIESEQVRLGMIQEGTDSEYEQLRVKIEQAYVSKLISEAERTGYINQLAQLQDLQNRKKDIHTLSMEYQRELSEQESIGYNAAKAGLQSLENGMAQFFDVTSDGWLDWHKLASSILSDITKQLLQQLVIKQIVGGIASGISYVGTQFSTASQFNTTPFSQQTTMLADQMSGFKDGGMIPVKKYATGGVLHGGTGIRDDIYLGSASGAHTFAMGGEFMTRKSSVNSNTIGTLDYINKTGTLPSTATPVNVPVSINVQNQTSQDISAEMIESISKPNERGEYEKVINIVLKASREDPRMRGLLKR